MIKYIILFIIIIYLPYIIKFLTYTYTEFYAIFYKKINIDYTKEIYKHLDNKESVLYYANIKKNPKIIYLIEPGGNSSAKAKYIKKFISDLKHRMCCVYHKPGILSECNRAILPNEINYTKNVYTYLKNKYENIKICCVGFSLGGTSIYKFHQKYNADACVCFDFPISPVDSLYNLRKSRIDFVIARLFYNRFKNFYKLNKPKYFNYKYLLNFFTESNNIDIKKLKNSSKIDPNIIPKKTLVIRSFNDLIIPYNKNNHVKGTHSISLNFGGHCNSVFIYDNLSKKIDEWVSNIIKK